MDSYYSFFCATKARAVRTALSTVAAVTTLSLTVMSFMRAAQGEHELADLCDLTNRTSHEGRRLLPGQGVHPGRVRSCDEIFIGEECISRCEDVMSMVGQSWLMVDVALIAITLVFVGYKVHQAVAPSVELVDFGEGSKDALVKDDDAKYGTANVASV